MRSVLLVLLIASCILPAAQAAAGDRLALVDYGPDLVLRDRLIRDTAVFADLGGKLSCSAFAKAVAEGIK